jgi:hypothetical protein
VNNRFLTLSILIFAYITSVSFSASVNAGTYRWVDDQGHVHYSDHVPPKDLERGYSVMNKEGVTVDKVTKAKTKKQREKEKRLKNKQEEQQKHDRILLDTYTKVGDLEETRDRYIATIEGLIKVAQHKLTGLNNNLEKLNSNAANLERNGKAMPKEMRNDIANIQSQIDLENNFIVSQRNQQEEVRKKFAADIKRFQELKAAENGNPDNSAGKSSSR